jgi:hypothetical protein
MCAVQDLMRRFMGRAPPPARIDKDQPKMTKREISEGLITLIHQCDQRASAQLIARAIIQRFDLTPREQQPAEADPANYVSRASTR